MLDGGPSRAQRPVDNRAAYRGVSSARRQPQEQQLPPQDSNDVYRNSATQPNAPERKTSKRWLIIAAILVAVILIAALVWFAMSNRDQAAVAIDGSKYQAVELINGQYYFGKLELLENDYMRLTDVFYIQSNATGEDAEAESPQDASEGNMQLIKLGEEVHGPEDTIVINRDQVLLFENLKPDSRVSELIRDYQPTE